MRFVVLLTLGLAAFAQAPPKSIHPGVRKIVDEVSSERIAATMKKLGEFQTRHLDMPGHEAARAWIETELRSYSPRLQVRTDRWTVPKMVRVKTAQEVANLVAVLPGKTEPATQILVTAHYDTIAFPSGQNENAPGVTDNGSGTAEAMELARVLSQHEFDKTLVFAIFDGEEEALYGSTLHSMKAKADKTVIEAMLNNDIIGTDTSGNGYRATHVVNVYSGEPMDSGSRALARYVKEVAERYTPDMRAELVFRADRFGRGGDHTPFHQRGFAAVRFTTPAEQLTFQHTPNDNFENSSPPYTTRVAQINAAAAASLALAPAAPKLATLGRGESHYDADLKWEAVPRAAGYSVLVRATTAPFWEREFPVGAVTHFILKNVSVDTIVIGVRAWTSDGVESLVSAYAIRERPDRDIEASEKK